MRFDPTYERRRVAIVIWQSLTSPSRSVLTTAAEEESSSNPFLSLAAETPTNPDRGGG